MNKSIYVGIGIAIAIAIVIGAYGAISQSETDNPNGSDESVGFSDTVTPVLETGEPEEPEPEGKSLEVTVSDSVASEEFP